MTGAAGLPAEIRRVHPDDWLSLRNARLAALSNDARFALRGEERIETEGPVPIPGEGEFLVEIHYISLDPAMRGWMNDMRSYVPPVQIDEVMRALGAGRIVESNHPGFEAGTYEVGLFGVQEYAVSDGNGVIPVDPALAPLPTYLGALGMPGMTAYFGLLEIGQPREGETVVVADGAEDRTFRADGNRRRQCSQSERGLPGGAQRHRA